MCIYWDGNILKKLDSRNWNKGSYTVEASLILPLIFFVLLYFIYFSFYLHDKEIMTNVAYETALVGSSGGIIDGASIRRYSKEELLVYGDNRIDGILISTKLKNILVENDEKEIRVSISGEFLNPFSSGFGFQLFTEKEIIIVQTIKCQDSPDYVRRSQVVVEGIKKLWE